jgi:hypothetical protein
MNKWLILTIFCIYFVGNIYSEEFIEYKIVQGDTLSKISKEYLKDPGNWRELLKYNKIDTPNKIQPGLVIRIPDYLQKNKNAPKTIAKVTKKLGTVKFKRVNEKDWSDATVGLLLSSDDSVLTKETSAAEILFFDDPEVSVSLKENAIMKVKQDKIKSIELGLGESIIKFLKHSKDNKEVKFNVVTPTSVAGVRATEFSASTDQAGLDKYACTKGLIQVSAQGVTVEVPEGFATSVKKGEPPETPTRILEKVKIKPLIKSSSD